MIVPHPRSELEVDLAALAPRKRILVACRANPVTTAAYLERALRRRHDVLTWGPSIDRATLFEWNLGAIQDRIVPTDLGYRSRRPARALARRAPGWRPDLLLWIETGKPFPMEGIEELGCRTACYLIDTHLESCDHLAEADLAWARSFDLVFLAQRASVTRFRAAGLAAHWLPLACDPEIHAERPVARVLPIGFAGTLDDPRRIALISRLASRFFVTERRSFLDEMAELYSRSRVVFNCAVNADLNMRVFEAMAAGALLLTDPAPGSGLSELFCGGEHCAIYESDEELLEVARSWLADRKRTEQVARAGQKEALARHTYAHRVALLERIAFPLVGRVPSTRPE